MLSCFVLAATAAVSAPQSLTELCHDFQTCTGWSDARRQECVANYEYLWKVGEAERFGCTEALVQLLLPWLACAGGFTCEAGEPMWGEHNDPLHCNDAIPDGVRETYKACQKAGRCAAGEAGGTFGATWILHNEGCTSCPAELPGDVPGGGGCERPEQCVRTCCDHANNTVVLAAGCVDGRCKAPDEVCDWVASGGDGSEPVIIDTNPPPDAEPSPDADPESDAEAEPSPDADPESDAEAEPSPDADPESDASSGDGTEVSSEPTTTTNGDSGSSGCATAGAASEHTPDLAWVATILLLGSRRSRRRVP